MFHARAATPADRGSLVAWMHALYVEDPSPDPMTAEKAARTLDTLEREPSRGQAVVLEASGAPAGYALLASVWSNELGGVVCVVDEIYVAPSHRGRGLATWLVRSLLERSTPWFGDAVAFELEVSPDNVRARALYERLGFRAKRNAVLRFKG
ncbi:MAG TPA: GNAT family N-acetyltransferase [Polyangiaceae bacterium]